MVPWNRGTVVRTDDGIVVRTDDTTVVRADDGTVVRTDDGSVIRTDDGTHVRTDDGTVVCADDGYIVRTDDGSVVRTVNCGIDRSGIRTVIVNCGSIVKQPKGRRSLTRLGANATCSRMSLQWQPKKTRTISVHRLLHEPFIFLQSLQ